MMSKIKIRIRIRIKIRIKNCFKTTTR